MRAASSILLLLCAVALAAQETAVFRAETSLALVRFHVVKKNAYVDALRAEDIVLLEDGVPQAVTLFEGGRASERKVPMELILLFDLSGSVTHKGFLDAVAFQQNLLQGFPGLKLSVYGFHSRLLQFCGPTRDAAELARVFGQVASFSPVSEPKPRVIAWEAEEKRKKGGGGSWIYESVAGAAREAMKGPGNPTRMMLVVSDGFSTTGAEAEDVAPLLKELGMPVYPLVLGHAKMAERAKQLRENGVNRQGAMKEGARRQMDRLQDQERELEDFASLGELTGGRSFDPLEMNPVVMRQVLGAMAALVEYEYVVGFAPAAGNGAVRKHKVEVKLRSKETGKVLGGVRSLLH